MVFFVINVSKIKSRIHIYIEKIYWCGKEPLTKLADEYQHSMSY